MINCSSFWNTRMWNTFHYCETNCVNFIIATINRKIGRRKSGNIGQTGRSTHLCWESCYTRTHSSLLSHQNVNKSGFLVQIKNSEVKTVSGPSSLPSYVTTISLFLTDAKLQNGSIKLCQKRLQFVKETKIGKQRVETKLVNHKILFDYFARSYIYSNLGRDIQILWSWVAEWCMCCVTLRVPKDIKKL